MLQRLFDVTRTTVFQIMLICAVIASFFIALTMFIVYQNAQKEIFEQIDIRLFQESSSLRNKIENSYNYLDFQAIRPNIITEIGIENKMSFCLISLQHLDSHLLNVTEKDSLFFNSDNNEICNFHNIEHNKGNIRLIIRPIKNLFYLLVVAYDISNEQEILKRMKNSIVIATAILLLIGIIGGLFLSNHFIKIIAHIRRTAREIVDGDFSRRIPNNKNNNDEISLLKNDLNHMLEKIESLIISQRQVTNNIAHDLRNPLNRLRNRMEVALLDKKLTNENFKNIINSSILDADHLLETFNALLDIAQIESRAKNDFEIINISEICIDIAELYEVLIEENEAHQFYFEIEENLHSFGNKHLLAQALTNLLDNAIKYSPNGGLIELIAKEENNKIVIIVSDKGIGVPEDKYHEIFKRFVRLDSARSTSGNGLGLSLVAAVNNLHNGTLELSNNHSGLKIKWFFKKS